MFSMRRGRAFKFLYLFSLFGVGLLDSQPTPITDSEILAIQRRYLPLEFQRVMLGFYEQVDDRADVRGIVEGRTDFSGLDSEPALFARHGRFHMSEVIAAQLRMNRQMDGTYFVPKEGEALNFQDEIGVLLGAKHDIGMHDLTPSGRTVHPDFAAQFIFTPKGQRAVDSVLDNSHSEIAKRVARYKPGASREEQRKILTEILSLSMAHSKSRIPIDILSNPSKLRAFMQKAESTPLVVTEAEINLKKAKSESAREKAQAVIDANKGKVNEVFQSYYGGDTSSSYAWLTDENPIAQEIRGEVNDSLRKLAIADAIRDRGINLRASGGHQLAFDADAGKAIMFLNVEGCCTVPMHTDSPFTVGESKLGKIYFDPQGNLHFEIENGNIKNPEARQKAIEGMAHIVNDVVADALGRLKEIDPSRRGPIDPAKTKIIIQAPVDDQRPGKNGYGLAGELATYFYDHYGEGHGLTPDRVSSEKTSAERVAKFEEAKDLALAEDMRFFGRTAKPLDSKSFERMKDDFSRSGLDISGVKSIEGVKVLEIAPGEALLHAGARANYVYVPLDHGLSGTGNEGNFDIPLNNYLGVTGLYRNAERNATIVNSSNSPLRVLAIPAQKFKQNGWSKIYTPEEAGELIQNLPKNPDEARTKQLVPSLQDENHGPESSAPGRRSKCRSALAA